MRIERIGREHFDRVKEIYAEARAFMRKSGNHDQWAGGYPPDKVIFSDIERGRLFGVFDEGELVAVFYFAIESDPTYTRIYSGEWKNGLEYGVIHRVAVCSSARGRGVSSFIFSFCKEQIPSLRIDTHRDNIPMQRALLKNGFEYCGIIHLLSGDERLAYQYTNNIKEL